MGDFFRKPMDTEVDHRLKNKILFFKIRFFLFHGQRQALKLVFFKVSDSINFTFAKIEYLIWWQVKKVVTVIKESNMFGDVLSSIMNDDKEKIKKRKIAERRAERKAKEQVCSMLV